MKKIFSLLVFLGVFWSASAQNTKVTTAFNYITSYTRDNIKEDLEKAKKAIDEASVYESTKAEPKTWFYVAMVYDLISQDKDYSAKYPNSDQVVKDAIQKTMDLDTKGNYKEKILNMLKMTYPTVFNDGVKAYKEGNYNTAYDKMKDAIEANEFMRKYDTKLDFDTSAYKVCAFAAEQINKKDEASSLYQKLIDINVNEAAIYLYQCKLLKEVKKDDQAKAVLDKGLKMFPTDKSLLIEQVNMSLSSGNNSEALTKMETALKNDPNNHELLFALASTYDKMTQQDKAIEYYNKAIKLKPDYFDALFNLGALYYNQAIDLTKKMNDLPMNADDQFEALKSERGNKFKLAMPILEEALKINPTDFNTKVALKEIYARTDQAEKAKKLQEELEKK